MRHLRWFLYRLTTLARVGKRERDLDAELRFHLGVDADEGITDGVGASDAQNAARRSLGNLGHIREDARAVWGRFSDHMDANRGDLRGFAEKEGLASVHPTMQGDRPVLVASRCSARGWHPESGARGSGTGVLVDRGQPRGRPGSGVSARHYERPDPDGASRPGRR